MHGLVLIWLGPALGLDLLESLAASTMNYTAGRPPPGMLATGTNTSSISFIAKQPIR